MLLCFRKDLEVVNVTSASMLPRPQLADTTRFSRASPPLAALAYPGLIWCGPVVAPVFLAIAMGVPLIGLLVAHRLDQRRYPLSRWIALFVVATPPLYSFLGGWLDGKHPLPFFKGLQAWMLLWLVASCVALWERPAQAGPSADRPASHRLRLPFAHGVSASLITLFAIAHLANHFAGLWGGERHVAIMHALRQVYRNPVVETVLVGCIAFQLLSGWVLLRRKLEYVRNWVDTLQAASAVYLVMFFLSHLSAVFRARLLKGTDTDWTWLTADNLFTDPWSARLVPYYFLGIVALGVHGGAGVRRVMLNHGQALKLADSSFYALAVAAALLSAAIMTGLISASLH
jgi:succinate dehydrogenase/fumarate reductase cytochrome b subunit